MRNLKSLSSLFGMIIICVALSITAGCAAIYANPKAGFDEKEKSSPSAGSSEFPVSGTPSDFDRAYVEYPASLELQFGPADALALIYPIGVVEPLNRENIKKIFLTKSFEGFEVFFFQGEDLCTYAGAETEKGLFTLFQTDQMNPPVYTSTYDISEFTNILGHDGFKVTAGMGAAYMPTAYYSVEEGRPVYLADANLASESDLDGDGDLEVISSIPSHASTCFIIKSFDKEIKWSGDIQQLLPPMQSDGLSEVEFDSETLIFSARFAEKRADDPNNITSFVEKQYEYFDERLILKNN